MSDAIKIKKRGLIKRFWSWCWRPSPLALATLLLIGFAAGIICVFSFHASIEYASSEKFCISCHEMRNNVYEEYIETSHFSNRSGVRATCSDCHIPQEFFPMVWRKIQASKEVYGHLTGIIDTPQKFDNMRKEMAMREWDRMKANDSKECRNCHQSDLMDLSLQKTVAASLHQKAEQEGKTCIDCHKGIAHKLPDMTGIEPGY